jgi:hypothetical protein
MPVEGRKRRSAGDLGAAKRLLWSGILEATRIVEDPHTRLEWRLRAISALSTAVGVYGHLLHDHETEQRLTALEDASQHERHGDHAE